MTGEDRTKRGKRVNAIAEQDRNEKVANIEMYMLFLLLLDALALVSSWKRTVFVVSFPFADIPIPFSSFLFLFFSSESDTQISISTVQGEY